VFAFDAIAVWYLTVASFLNSIVWSGSMPLRRTLLGDLAAHGRMVQEFNWNLTPINSRAAELIRKSQEILGVKGVGWVG